MRYALVENGVVTNIIEMDKRNEQFFPSAVYTGDRPVGMGDTYTEAKRCLRHLRKPTTR